MRFQTFPRHEWHRWYAWFPVHCEGEWVWLEEVWRRWWTALYAEGWEYELTR